MIIEAIKMPSESWKYTSCSFPGDSFVPPGKLAIKIGIA
jgi:hypothetical protein